MVRQIDAQRMCDSHLRKFGLYTKGWRTCFSKDETHLGKCWHDEKRIQLSILMLNSCSEVEVEQTILHEIAHALVGPNQGHNKIWHDKALELGVRDPKPCGNMNIDAGRGLKEAEIKPKRTFHRVNKPCPYCGKIAEVESTMILNNKRWSKLRCGHLLKYDQIEQAIVDYTKWESASGKVIYPFQVEGIKFLERAGGRGLIADEPALGKTIQALGFLYFHHQEVCPCLWVCKSTLKLQALKEALDWCGMGFMGQIITSSRSFILPNLKLYIISMDLLRNMPTEKLEKIGYKTVVADEIQHFKNPDSTRTAELRRLVSKADYFLPLSGTPWKNRGQEYYPVLNMLDPTRFPSYEKFKNDWVGYYFDEKTGKNRQGGLKRIPEFREYTKDMVIRRMRDDVLPDLPKVQRNIRFIDMEALYSTAYEKMEEKVAFTIKAAMIDGKNPRFLASELMKLKHITGLAKCSVAIEDTIEFLENTPDEAKITIFHHHIDVGDNIQKGDPAGTYTGLDAWLRENEYDETLRLYGGRTPEERNRVIEEFKNNPRKRVLIASTLASGEGLNIQFCQNAMQVERQWNPQNEEQAELRFSRPLTWGDYPPYLQHHLFDTITREPKKVSITVPYLIADQTIDSMLTDLVERKRHNYRRSMNEKDVDLVWEENDILNELAELIIKKRFGKGGKNEGQVEPGIALTLR